MEVDHLTPKRHLFLNVSGLFLELQSLTKMDRIDREIDVERGSSVEGSEPEEPFLGLRVPTKPSPLTADLLIDVGRPGTGPTPGIESPDSHIDVSPSNSAHSGIGTEDLEPKPQMDLNLYWAARQREEKDFTAVLDQITREKRLMLSAEQMLSAVIAQVSPTGNTYLHVAASYNNEAIVRYIAGCPDQLITMKNFNDDTALHLAARAGHTSTVKTLVDLASSEGQDEGQVDQENLVRIRNKQGNTALHEAVINSHDEIADRLIKADPQLAFCLNNEQESPLYLAAKAGSVACVKSILSSQKELPNMFEQVKNERSPIHAAISSRNKDVLELMLETAPEFIHFIDEGRFPLHYASSMGYREEVQYILNKFPSSANERDRTGLLSIHWASMKGHVSLIKKLLLHWPDPAELCDQNGRNILHFAAKSGKCEVVRYILKDPTLEGLINMKDKQGNTPLHLATRHSHPDIVSALTWDSRVNLTAVNSRGMTALDAAYHNDHASSFQQRLTWAALRAAGVPRAFLKKSLDNDWEASTPGEPRKSANYKDRVNTLLLVSTLVATVTFAAGFTMPGGYNNSDPNQGMATMLGEKMFRVFIFCDTIAMFSSIIVAVSLIWAQLGDLRLVIIALKLALPLLGIALAMMSFAFVAGVSVVVSKLKWLYNAIWIIGASFLVILSILFFPLCFSLKSTKRPVRYIFYYPFLLLVWVTKAGPEI